jgi:hypothetical protein
MKVSELIKHLKGFNPNLQVYVRQEESYSGNGADYWELTKMDVISGDIRDLETEKEYPAVLIGDDRV